MFFLSFGLCILQWNNSTYINFSPNFYQNIYIIKNNSNYVLYFIRLNYRKIEIVPSWKRYYSNITLHILRFYFVICFYRYLLISFISKQQKYLNKNEQNSKNYPVCDKTYSFYLETVNVFIFHFQGHSDWMRIQDDAVKGTAL